MDGVGSIESVRREVRKENHGYEDGRDRLGLGDQKSGVGMTSIRTDGVEAKGRGHRAIFNELGRVKSIEG